MYKVLIVDNDPQVRKTLHDVLQSAGYHAEEAPDGDKAMTLWLEDRTAIVLTDLFMQGTNGIETIMELKRTWTKTKIIAMSGKPYLLPAAKLLGADHILEKPFDRQHLLRAISDLCGLETPLSEPIYSEALRPESSAEKEVPQCSNT